LQADAEKPEQSRRKKYSLAMKILSFEQMESVSGSKFRLACLGQVADGMGLLGGAAFLLAASNPIGWGILAFSAIGFAASAIADPSACD
jgi:hypothetical protein